MPNRASFSLPPSPVLHARRIVSEELWRFGKIAERRPEDSELLLRLQAANGRTVEVWLDHRSFRAVRAAALPRDPIFLVWRTRVGHWRSDTEREEISEHWELAGVKADNRFIWRDGQCDLHLRFMRRGRLRSPTIAELRTAMSGWHTEFCHPGVLEPVFCGLAIGPASRSDLAGYICRECETAFAARR